MKQFFLFLLILANVFTVWAQGPNNSGEYYKNANGTKGSALKTALAGIIRNHKTISYNGLWECYKTTDVRSDGKIWDMYSNTTSYVPGGSCQGASYKKEGDSYNREHSMPKSWFDNAAPMNSDLMHVVPTDGYVNNRRSNYPYGETNSPTYTSNGGFCKLGKCSVSGYSGTVFEPADEYKGDLARIYFYMVTCYENNVSSWSSEMLCGDKYPAISKWALDMLLRWAQDDPVSQKEINRNEEVFKLQGNRNPYVDYPGLEQYVWGSNKDKYFVYDDFGGVYNPGTEGDGGNTGVGGDDTGGGNVDDGGNTGGGNTGDGGDNGDTPQYNADGILLPGNYTFSKLSDMQDITLGAAIIVCEKGKALGDAETKYFKDVDVTISDNTILTAIGAKGQTHQLLFTPSGSYYTIYDPLEEAYLSLSSDDNSLRTSSTVSDSELWSITLTAKGASIVSKKYSDRSINYNSSSPRFACYKSSSAQQPIYIYIDKVTSNVSSLYDLMQSDNNAIYSLDGKQVGERHKWSSLPAGVYVINGRKVVK